MATWRQRLYDHSPWVIKRQLVALEARRRNRYRRYGDYEACKRELAFARHHEMSRSAQAEVQQERLATFLGYVRNHSPFYRERIPPRVDDPSVLTRIPVLTKDDVRHGTPQMFDPDYDRRHVWVGKTSGSTGTPLQFFVGREGIRARTAIQDNYYEMFGCHYGERRVRFGGSQIVPVSTTRPPFWVYNGPDNQLQMSAYHIDARTLPEYVRMLEKFEPAYFTGYGHAQYLVAQHLSSVGGLKKPPRALFTDSEGLLPEYHRVIEEGFGAPSYDVYGLGEVGWIAVQCHEYRYHVLDLTCVLEAVDDAGRPLPHGELGRLVVTDLTQTAFPYVRYDTGDAGVLSTTSCACGMNTIILESIEGRSDDLIVTPQGRRVGRLSHVTKPGRGILESQIVQTRPDHVVIRVVPTSSFDQESMTEVVQVAHGLLGDDMHVDWELVDTIPRTKLHKFKHVVREFSL